LREAFFRIVGSNEKDRRKEKTGRESRGGAERKRNRTSIKGDEIE